MNQVIRAAVLLLGLSTLLSACNKDSSTSSIFGLWVRTDYEVIVNGEKGEKDESTDESFSYAPGSIQFDNDGTGILGSIVHFTYKQDGNSITLSAPGTGTDGVVLEIVGNRIVFVQGTKSASGEAPRHLNVFYEKQK